MRRTLSALGVAGALLAVAVAPAEYELFYRLGVDGVFTDHPDTAVAARAGLA